MRQWCERCVQVASDLVQINFRLTTHCVFMPRGVHSTHFAYQFITYEPGPGLDLYVLQTGHSLEPLVLQGTTSGTLSA